MRLSDRARFVSWLCLILLIVVPWTDYQDHSHWSRVQWMPFRTPPVKMFDVIVNLLLYAPLGYWGIGAEAVARKRRAILVMAAAAALSAVTEWSQLFSHSRFPSATDVVCNVVGASAGMVWRLSREAARLRRLGPAPRPESTHRPAFDTAAKE